MKPSTQQQLANWASRFAPWNSLITFVVWNATILYAGFTYIENTARNAVLDEKFLATLAAKVRPSFTFDSSGSILTDSGASEYLDSKIEITAKPKEFEYEIRFYCKKTLNCAPIVQAIDARLMQVRATRGPGNDWIVTMGNGETYSALSLGGDMDTKSVRHFRVEILH